MKSTVLVIIIMAILAGVFAAAGHSVSTRDRGVHTWRTEAWATTKLKRIHYWHGYRIDPEWSDCSIGGVIGWGRDHYNRAGEQMYQHFRCNMQAGGWTVRAFNVTIHAMRYWPYYKITAGWVDGPLGP